MLTVRQNSSKRVWLCTLWIRQVFMMLEQFFWGQWLTSSPNSSPSRKVIGYSSPIVALRKKLDLYANIRPVVSVSSICSQIFMPLNCSCKGCSRTWSEAFRRSHRGQGKYRMSCMYSPSPNFWAALKLSYQYVKQETQINGEHGLEARAIRVITERASRRIGQMAFELARARPRKVHISRNVFGLRNSSSFFLSRLTSSSPSFISQTFSQLRTACSEKQFATSRSFLKTRANMTTYRLQNSWWIALFIGTYILSGLTMTRALNCCIFSLFRLFREPQ